MFLMQMVKVLMVIVEYDVVGLLYIVVLIDLIMGGVMVSFVMEGDIILVELWVLVGFVGCWVIE